MEARNAKEAILAPMAGCGGVCVLAVWSLESDGRIFIGAFGRNVGSLAVNLLSYLFQLIKKFYKCCSCKAICNYNDEN